MPKAPVWSAAVGSDGLLHVHADKAYQAYLSTLKGKPLDVIVRRHVRHRTPPQLAYYFAVVIPEFAHHEGYRRDEHYMLHDGLMHKFWPLEPDKVTKAPRRRRLTLDDGCGPEPPLSDEEMSIHIEQVKMFAAERGCVISDAERCEVAA